MDGSPNPAPANKKGRLSPPTPKTSLDTKFHTLPVQVLRRHAVEAIVHEILEARVKGVHRLDVVVSLGLSKFFSHPT